ncbi:hypothetical protein E2C01_098697 [Portunus trituberculatus]|uniref:Uncharacterized protein n=1 Tax=Portunus trituberculatus TaxID=210409 RepID=A0A5B7KDJ2_PORTR|nr:hypothetical protein [Portunus trituberculatus]
MERLSDGARERDMDGWPGGVMKGLWDRGSGSDGRGAPAGSDKRYSDGAPLRKGGGAGGVGEGA